MDKKKKETPFIVPLFIPHIGCPFQCAFCNQKALTSVSRKTLSEKNIRNDIDEFLSFKTERKTTELAFYGGTFLGLDKSYLKLLLDIGQSYINEGRIDSIRFSTRPDTINDINLDLLENYSVGTIEIGVQSMDDDVLKSSNRGHTRDDVINAVNLVKKRGYSTGMQLMAGLPGDSEKISINTALDTARLRPDFVRIYPTLVLKGSPMEVWFTNDSFRPHTLEESVSIVKKMLVIFLSENIKVIRTGIQASKDLEEGSEILSGPYHPSYGHMVSSAVFYDLIENSVKKEGLTGSIEIACHTTKVSEVRGLKNSNRDKLIANSGITEINFACDDTLMDYELNVNGIKTDISDIVNAYKI